MSSERQNAETLAAETLLVSGGWCAPSELLYDIGFTPRPIEMPEDCDHASDAVCVLCDEED